MSDTKQKREAVGPRLDRGVAPLQPEARQWKPRPWARCATHGPEEQTAWGCPHCVAELREEVRKLRAFANDIMDCWPDGDVDGAYLQDMAEKHGLLTPERRYEPCGEACTCAGTVEHADWVDGVVCYRRTALLKGHNAEVRRARRPEQA